jgi:hypothetical protein
MIATRIDMSQLLTSPWGVTRTVAEWMKAHEVNQVYEIYQFRCGMPDQLLPDCCKSSVGT